MASGDESLTDVEHRVMAVLRVSTVALTARELADLAKVEPANNYNARYHAGQALARLQRRGLVVRHGQSRGSHWSVAQA